MENKTGLDALTVQKNVLAYLAALPSRLKHPPHGSESFVGQFSVQLGNCLVWIAPALDGTGPLIETGCDVTAQTVHQLGKQFQNVGRELWTPTRQHRESDIALLTSRIVMLEQMICELHLKEAK